MWRHELSGWICSAGFASGDRFVVGVWEQSPIGPINDIMHALPDGTRRLFAPDQRTAQFVTEVYAFDRVETVPVRAEWRDRTLEIGAGELALSVTTGRPWPLPPGSLRPAWFTRTVEGPLARVLVRVRTYGVARGGIREWYGPTNTGGSSPRPRR
jgi:hypothetical protein